MRRSEQRPAAPDLCLKHFFYKKKTFSPFFFNPYPTLSAFTPTTTRTTTRYLDSETKSRRERERKGGQKRAEKRGEKRGPSPRPESPFFLFFFPFLFSSSFSRSPPLSEKPTSTSFKFYFQRQFCFFLERRCRPRDSILINKKNEEKENERLVKKENEGTTSLSQIVFFSFILSGGSRFEKKTFTHKHIDISSNKARTHKGDLDSTNTKTKTEQRQKDQKEQKKSSDAGAKISLSFFHPSVSLPFT